MKYFLWFLVSIALIVLTFALIFHGFSGKKTTLTPLVTYANTNATVQITEHGPLVADQQYQGYRITIGQTESEIDVLQGYADSVTNTKMYSNNQTAYAQFLRALDLDGFQKGNAAANVSDSRGYCAGGDRYQIEIISNGSDAENYWTTSCGQGNFKGDLAKISLLFRRQIPDFSGFTNNLNL